MRVFINGKFLRAPRTGVQRTAFELTRALDEIASKGSDGKVVEDFVLSYPGPGLADLDLKAISTISGGGLPPMAWEQIYFPWQTRNAFALNMCNSGSFLTHRAVTIIHDAQVYSSPNSYSRPFRLWYKFLLPLLGRRHSHIVTVSDYSKAQLVQYGVAPAHKISVVHNGVDHILSTPSDASVLEKLGLAQEGYVLALSTTQSHKNIKILIEAFDDPSLSGLKLVLFGKATREDFRAALGRDLGDRIVFAGKVNDSELRGLMENALCLGFPSTTEGFGLPVLEAMLLGCPSVVAPAGALPEICGSAVIYAAPGRSQEWVTAFNTLGLQPEMRRQVVEKGLVQAKAFTWANAARKLSDILRTFAR